MLNGENWWAWLLVLLAGVGVAVALFLGFDEVGTQGALELCRADRPEWAETTVETPEVLRRNDGLGVQLLGKDEGRFTVCEGIARRWLWEGMSEAMAQRSWGPPHRYERSTEEDGERVVLEWLYDPAYMREGGAVLRFVDGHLVNWRLVE